MSGAAPTNRLAQLGPSAAPLDASPLGGELLRRSGDRILEGWDQISAGWMASREEAAAVLARIAEDVERIRSGGALDPKQSEVSRPLLHHRLTEALRAELLGAWDSPPEQLPAEAPKVALQLLRALDEYRSRLWDDWQDDLAKRLSEPDAFELVVELAHDLRSPLNSILFLSEVLRSGHSGPVTEHQRSQLGLIYSATLGIISVVNDVMDIAGDRKGAADEVPVPFAIGKVFESVEEIVLPMAEEKGVELRILSPERDRCVGWPKQLSRVLLNLTTNALRFTEKGNVTVSAKRLEGDRIEFSVSDTGKGIPAEKLHSLFHPFQKSAYRSGYFFSGSGLGLSIAQRIVTRMGSELGVESTEGVGTRFYFELELPLADSARGSVELV